MICTFLSTITVVGALLAVVLPIAVLAAPTKTGASSPIAFITDLQGRVTLQRAGAATPLTHSEVLYAGDVLNTGQDGYATLFQRFAPMEVLAPQQTVSITPLPPVGRDDVLTAEGSARIIKHFSAAAQSVDEASREATRGTDEVAITALAPRHSLVLDMRPTFVWTPVMGATGYKVTLYDHNDDIIWEATTRELEVAYPIDREPLAAGQYAWDVLVTVGNRRVLDTAPFTIAGEAEVVAVRHLLEQATRLVLDTNRTNLPYMALAFEHRLYPQAEVVLQASTARSPHDRVLWELSHSTELRGGALSPLRLS